MERDGISNTSEKAGENARERHAVLNWRKRSVHQPVLRMFCTGMRRVDNQAAIKPQLHVPLIIQPKHFISIVIIGKILIFLDARESKYGSDRVVRLFPSKQAGKIPCSSSTCRCWVLLHVIVFLLLQPNPSATVGGGVPARPAVHDLQSFACVVQARRRRRNSGQRAVREGRTERTVHAQDLPLGQVQIASVILVCSAEMVSCFTACMGLEICRELGIVELSWHACSKVPSIVAKVAPKDALKLEEKAYNAYPYWFVREFSLNCSHLSVPVTIICLCSSWPAKPSCAVHSSNHSSSKCAPCIPTLSDYKM